MVIGGFQKSSLSDFPGVISCILFTRGCSFRCPYCHNPELVDPARYVPALEWSDVRRFLESRSGRIEGVVVTGGEPTFHPDLPDLLAEIRAMRFKVKLDTNGSNPGLLRQVVAEGMIDFLAMDLKGPLDRYPTVTGVPVDTRALRESLILVRTCGLPYEIRTTWAPHLVTVDDLVRVSELVRGCPIYALQAFRPGRTLDPALARMPATTAAQLEEAAHRLADAGVTVEIR